MRTKKGQMVFEFVVAVIVFFGVVFYVINQLNVAVSTSGTQYFNVDRQNKALLMTEVLAKSPGVWDGTEPHSVGLVDEWPVFNETKIQNFGTFCENEMNYVKLLEAFGMERKLSRDLQFNITITDVDLVTGSSGETVSMSCGRSVPNLPRAMVERFGVMNTPTRDVVRMSVWVW